MTPGQFTNSSYPHNAHSSSRTKMTFKEIHTVYGRPVLRDRNEWRYQKRDESNKSAVLTGIDAAVFREQNLLISL